MNITIFASIGSGNLGDELILKNEIQLLREEFWEDTQFRVASYDIKNPFFEDEGIFYFEYFPIAFRNPKNILKNTKNLLAFLRNIIWSDIVVIWGGWIIYDSEKQSNSNPLNQWIMRSSIARVFRKKLYFYALGIDIKDPKNSHKLQSIFQNAWKITVRDTKSQKQLTEMWIESELVEDPVMSERSHSQSFPSKRREGGKALLFDPKDRGDVLWTHSSKIFQISDLKNYNLSGKKIGLALRKWYFSEYSKKENTLIEELCQYLESCGSKVIFLPHSFHSQDLLANDYDFLNQFMTETREIKQSMQEVYSSYTHKLTHLNITMRLHSIILSYVYDVDQIALSYSAKTDETLKKLRN